MKYNIKSLLILLLTLGFILSCAQAPQQIAKKSLAQTKDATVRLVTQDGKPITLGSGFFVDKDKIATNIHVVAQPGPVFAKLIDKETFLAVEDVVASDVKNNLVILKLTGEGTPLPIGNSDIIHIGESISVVGYADAKYKTVLGTIASIQRTDKWFEMRVSTSKESSGGPVLNSKGQVIGITVYYGDDSDNYAIPSNALKALLAQSTPPEPLTEWRKQEAVRAEMHYSQGEHQSAAKEYKEAIENFDKAITLNPEHVLAYYKRARAKFYINDYAGAIEDCTHAIKLNPEYARAYKGLCIIMCKLGDTESERGDTETARKLYYEGIANYDRYVQLENPKDADKLTAKISSTKGRASTVMLMHVSGGFAAGSGFFVDTDRIATNIHVVAKPGPIFAKLMDNETIWEANGVTAFDVQNDLVILKIDGEGTPLSLEDSNKSQIGESVVAVGYPFGKYRVTTGKINAIHKHSKWLGTTAEINIGNSGGPLLNDKGNVIGINTRDEKYSVVPSNILKALLNQTVSPEPLTQWQQRNHIRAHAYQSEGERRFISGEYSKAIISFNNAILHNPNFMLPYQWRGNTKLHLSQSVANQGDKAHSRQLYRSAKRDLAKAEELESKK